MQYVDHSTQPLILSASGDATVRLWTLQGHFVGTFGQEKLWNLESPSTFQHPKWVVCTDYSSSVSMPIVDTHTCLNVCTYVQ